MRKITLFFSPANDITNYETKSVVAYTSNEYQNYLSLIEMCVRELKKKGLEVRVEDKEISEEENAVLYPKT